MDIQSSMEELAKDYNSIVITANACSARRGKEIIGLVSIPAKRKTERSCLTFNYDNKECFELCESKCVGKLITVDFSKTKQYNDKIGYMMKESNF